MLFRCSNPFYIFCQLCFSKNSSILFELLSVLAQDCLKYPLILLLMCFILYNDFIIFFIFYRNCLFFLIYFILLAGLGRRCCARAFSSCGERGLLCCGAQASHCNGFTCWGARALGAWASVVVTRGLSSCGSQALEHRLSSCGAWAQLLRGMWDLPGPGLEPVSPALAGGFLTTEPPGKPHNDFIVHEIFPCLSTCPPSPLLHFDLQLFYSPCHTSINTA